MFGDNPKRKPVDGDGYALDIQEIFATIQGEGPNAGEPAVFIRLGGCNLACNFCDTEFESFNEMNVEDVLAQALQMREKQKLAVITGGEPLRQPIEKLCEMLVENGFKVQIETNGTLYRDLHEDVQIVCSPKNTGVGYSLLRGDLLPRIDALKFVVSAQNDLYSDIGEVGQSEYDIPVYIQPMDEQDKGINKENQLYAASLVKKYGAILSLQQHKILGLR